MKDPIIGHSYYSKETGCLRYVAFRNETSIKDQGLTPINFLVGLEIENFRIPTVTMVQRLESRNRVTAESKSNYWLQMERK